mmetsp:Transcript_23509/g.80075  ORF Transcript_23509/g.80075 Transcript_23509/m.80075 type:complete len:259 (+) Transcript_23509:1006-1782(+)
MTGSATPTTGAPRTGGGSTCRPTGRGRKGRGWCTAAGTRRRPCTTPSTRGARGSGSSGRRSGSSSSSAGWARRRRSWKGAGGCGSDGGGRLDPKPRLGALLGGLARDDEDAVRVLAALPEAVELRRRVHRVPVPRPRGPCPQRHAGVLLSGQRAVLGLAPLEAPECPDRAAQGPAVPPVVREHGEAPARPQHPEHVHEERRGEQVPLVCGALVPRPVRGLREVHEDVRHRGLAHVAREHLRGVAAQHGEVGEAGERGT